MRMRGGQGALGQPQLAIAQMNKIAVPIAHKTCEDSSACASPRVARCVFKAAPRPPHQHVAFLPWHKHRLSDSFTGWQGH